MDILLRLLRGILLGSVQGLTEFLPVSSSGHLLLLERAGVAPPSTFFNLLLHVATLMSVCIGLRKPLWQVVRHPFSAKSRWLALATVPTVALALCFELFAKQVLLGAYLAPCFMFTAVVLLLPKPSVIKNKPCVANSIITGVAQGIAVLPGISRSGITIATMRLCGFSNDSATELSFLLSVPIILGGVCFEFIGFSFSKPDWMVLVPAMLCSFGFGLLSLKVMQKAFCEKTALPFAIYLFALSIVSLF